MMIGTSNNVLSHSKRCFTFGSTFITFVTLGVLVINFKTCLAVFNVAEFVKLLGENHLDKRAIVSKNICETPGCIQAASTILSNLDTSIKPCDDFYRFACGNFVKNTVIPDDKARVDLFSMINDKLQEQLRISIQDGITDKDPRAFKLLQSYYTTCMDTVTIEKNSYDEFRAILKKVGGWPLIIGELWDESHFDWIKTIFKLRKIGFSYNYLLSFHIEIDVKNNSRQIINLDQASLGLSQEYLSKGINDNIVQEYFKLMIDFAEIFGSTREQAKKELMESLQFEIDLAKISLSSEQRRDIEKLYNIMSLADVEAKYPIFDWLNYTNSLLAQHAHVDSEEPVNVVVPRFFERLGDLIARTPKRVLANYIMWRVANDAASSLGERVQRIYLKYDAAIAGTIQREPRWKECIAEASDGLFLATGALYVRRYFDESSKTNTLGIIQNIRKSFESILLQVSWMDEKTRASALEKLNLIVKHIAYPNEFLDNDKIDEFHKFLKVYPESFLKSQLSLSLFNVAYMFSQLRKPVNKTNWITHGRSAIVNAFYDPTENSIQFPAGILQGAFFAEDRPKYLNYGAIGYIMGHEMTHGFDDEGRQFDKDGNLVEWWEPETKKKYLQRAQCIIDQYSNYTVKEVGLKINGVNTQGENIADNGGIKEAYFAYIEWEEQNGPEPRLPGLQFTSQQMFWISAANIWCNKYRPEALKSRIIVDAHSPGEFRILGPLSNMPEFSKDFNCPIGSAMNPSKKCSVW